MIDKNIYESKEFNENGNYFPIKKLQDSIFFKSVKVNPKYVDIEEIQLGIDTVEYSDSLFNYIGKYLRKDFINFKSRRGIEDDRSLYSVDGSFPLQIWVLGVYDHGTKYERNQYQFLEFLGNCGGFIEALLIILSLLVHFFCDITMKVKKIKIFKFLLTDINIESLYSPNFQFKLFLYEKFCCRNRAIKKFMHKDQ